MQKKTDKKIASFLVSVRLSFAYSFALHCQQEQTSISALNLHKSTMKTNKSNKQTLIILLYAFIVRGLFAEETCEVYVSAFPTWQEQTVSCYAGNFLEKMLSELNAGDSKTAEHVRVHLLPYLGGNETLNALYFDSPGDPNCLVCYTDPDTATALIDLRNTLIPEQIDSYDQLNVCYAVLTDRIMHVLTKSADEVWLVPDPDFVSDPTGQVISMFEDFFNDPDYGANSCPESVLASKAI